MTYSIEWSKEAETTYSNILYYLQEKWTEKEIDNFLQRTETVLKFIEKSPLIFVHSKKANIHRAVLSR